MSAMDILGTFSNGVIYAIIISPIIFSVIISLHFYRNYGRIAGPIMIVILLGVLISEYRWMYHEQSICEADKNGNGPCIGYIYAFIFGWAIAVILPITLTFVMNIGKYIRSKF
jgi:hypothetical protein